MTNVTFSENEASEQGGAIHYNYRRPNIEDCVFTDNIARYGPDIASYPVKIRMNEDINSDIHLNEVGSGINLDSPITLTLLDYDDQKMVLNSVDQISIFAVDTQQASVGGVNTVQLKEGSSVFDSIQFVSEIGSINVKFSAVSKVIDTSKVSELYGASTFNNEITVDFRFCKPGENIAGDI